FFSSRRRQTSFSRDWSSDVCSSDLKVFSSLLDLLIEEGYVRLENYFVDGTKLQADANRHTAVWEKNTKRYKENLQIKVKEILARSEERRAGKEESYSSRRYKRDNKI